MSESSAPLARRGVEPVVFRVLTLAFTIFIVAYVLIPIVVTLVMSFNDASQIRFPIKVWSFDWYSDFMASPQWTEALKNSFIIAVGTALISTTSGILAAWAFERYDFPFKSLLYILIMMPLFMPGVVLGLGVAIAFGGLQIGGVTIYGSRGFPLGDAAGFHADGSHLSHHRQPRGRGRERPRRPTDAHVF